MSFPKGTTEHPVNKSGKCNLLVSVWDFGAFHPQSERAYYAHNDHPAKMRPTLARAILQLYGESPVLDPMAGIGTTLVEAVLLGMAAVGVEYEKKFVAEANKNIQYIQENFHDKKLGKALCIRGDARDLSCLSTQKVNSVLFSPPYFNAVEAVSTGHQGPEGGHLVRQHKLAKEGKSGYSDKSNIGHAKKYGSIVFSPPYFNALKRGDEGPVASNKRVPYSERVRRFQGYSEDKNNIGNISKFGSIVFSPPYWRAMESQLSSEQEAMRRYYRSIENAKNVGGKPISKSLAMSKLGYGSSKDNIGNLKKFGSIIFSPPYWTMLHDHARDPNSYGARFPKEKNLPGPYSGDKDNIGNVKQFGSIVFSPPYANAMSHDRLKAKTHVGYYDWEFKKEKYIDLSYSKDKKNIGNMNERTYLGEMLKVYRECFSVLKPGKFMVVVVKDIRRKGLAIPLGADSIKLCQLAGFDVFDVFINKMYFPSFWQLAHARKIQAKGIPMALKTHEYIIVAKKPMAER